MPQAAEEGGNVAAGVEGFAPAPADLEADTAGLRKTREKAPYAETQEPQPRPAPASPGSGRLSAADEAALEDAARVAGKQERSGAMAGAVVGQAAPTARADADTKDQAETSYRMLEARTTASLPEARQLREAWRAFVRSHPHADRTDAARARLVEAGVAAYRLSRDGRDRDIARADAKEYLARPGAFTATVRTLLRELER
jgi:hypothetical protein